MNRLILTAVCMAMLSLSAHAQTADEIVSRYIQKIGGMDKISAIKTMRSTGKFTGGGGFEALIVNENKRPDMVRNEMSLQGMTAISAYNGKSGWKINPFGGKKDAESMSDEELKQVVEAADIDGPLINAAAKGNKIEYIGKEEYEGSDVFKLKVTLAGGTVKYFYLDTDYYVPIKIETKRMVRGTEVEFEQILGDYKEAGGVYFPFSIESGPKGGSFHSTVTFETIEINPVIDDSRFMMPAATKPQTPPEKP
jgi:outer membrane lipoprotein-sorting protein